MIVTYFSFTTLSTVGFGDFHPYSDAERIIGSIILIFGVAIFSYIMGSFIEVFKGFIHLNDTLDEGDQLLKFLGTLKKFNNNTPVCENYKKKLEQYFEYRWTNDQNQALRTDSDLQYYS